MFLIRNIAVVIIYVLRLSCGIHGKWFKMKVHIKVLLQTAVGWKIKIKTKQQLLLYHGIRTILRFTFLWLRRSSDSLAGDQHQKQHTAKKESEARRMNVYIVPMGIIPRFYLNLSSCIACVCSKIYTANRIKTLQFDFITLEKKS